MTRIVPFMLPRTETPDPVLVPDDLHNPVRERRELGPNQLRWLAKSVPGFRAAKRDADRAQRHADKINARVRG